MRHCLFCNSDEAYVSETSYSKPIKYVVECAVCGARGPVAKSMDMATKKWDGLLATIDDEKEFNELLKEDLGGVSSPISTINNVPGMGNAQPAQQAAMTGVSQYQSSALGSGDLFGTQAKSKRKKKHKKHKIKTLDQYKNKNKNK